MWCHDIENLFLGENLEYKMIMKTPYSVNFDTIMRLRVKAVRPLSFTVLVLFRFGVKRTKAALKNVSRIDSLWKKKQQLSVKRWRTNINQRS